MSFTGYPLR